MRQSFGTAKTAKETRNNSLVKLKRRESTRQSFGTAKTAKETKKQFSGKAKKKKETRVNSLVQLEGTSDD